MNPPFARGGSATSRPSLAKLGQRLARSLAFVLGAVGWASFAACDGGPSAAKSSIPDHRGTGTATTRGDAGAPAKVDVRTRWPAPERLVAVGDLHGDLAATRRVLALAGLAKDDRWTGGKSVLVQTGDILDRGDGERAIVDLLVKLRTEAQAAGGDVVLVNGNHELMNAAGDFRYVTPGGFAEFRGHDDGHAHPASSHLPAEQRDRAAALLPGGKYARTFAAHPVIAVVGDTVFVHGGLLPKWAREPERLNAEVSAWLAGGPSSGMRVVAEEDSPVWSRRYAENPDAEGCKLLDEALAIVGAKRMVVGHTVTKSGIAPGCEGKLWRIDVGLAAYYGGRTAALEITKDAVRPLSE